MNSKSGASLAGIFLASIFLTSTFAVPMPKQPKPYTGKGLAPAYLRCEYCVNPLGIGEPAPRLSWIVESGERAQRQTAYRLLVASSEKLLRQDRGDLWDTGWVPTNETICAVYQGHPLASYQRCFWKVKVWDRAGHDSAWSKPTMWSMGLLQPGDWQADWIGYDKPRQEILPAAPLDQAKWIWHAADEPGNVPHCQRLFFYRFNLPPDARIEQAELCASADDGMKFAINGHVRITTEPTNDSWRQARKASVAAELRPGPNELRVLVENAKPGDAGLIARLVITLEDGRVITQNTDGAWKSTDQFGDDWLGVPLDANVLPPVRALGDYGIKPWGKLEFNDLFLPPATYLRSEFRIDKPVARATLYATALGLVEMHLNGQRVGDDFFTPGWTDYNKRVYYRAYDVTKLVRRGGNALGAVLADGWFSGYIGYRGNRDLYGNYTRARAQLHLEYADGSVADIATGPSWKAATGPVLEADFLKGETYDARLECPCLE